MNSPEHQSAMDRQEIKIRPLANGLIVRLPDGLWYGFQSWEAASEKIGAAVAEWKPK